MKNKSLLYVVLLLGLLQVIFYYFIGISQTSHPFSVGVPQPDTLLYCQSAKQIANGEPFVFTPGDASSTGCTSHIYPFLLAVPYILGARGPMLLGAGFVINAVFYLVFVFCWFVIAKKLLREPVAVAVSMALLVCGGHAACCAFGQTDTGLIMAVSSAMLAALLCGRMKTFSILIAVAPWCRPEGVMLSVALLVAMTGRKLITGKKGASALWLAVIAGFVSSAGVFLFNYLLTGQFQFHSVEYKGYFNDLDFADAINNTASDFILIVKQIFLGSPDSDTFRSVLLIPVLGALAGWLGVFSHDWRHDCNKLSVSVMVVAALLSIMSVATSQYQGTNFDRYLAWLLPMWFLCIGEGIAFLWRNIRMKEAVLICISVMICWQIAGSVQIASAFALNSRICQQNYDCWDDMSRSFPTGASVGSRFSGIAYLLDGIRFKHLSGVFSPEFRNPNPNLNIELLKHSASSRFDFWLFNSTKKEFYGYDVSLLSGDALCSGINSSTFVKADWNALDRALSPHTNAVSGLSLIARVDVGYIADEKSADFKVNSRYHGLRYHSFYMDGTAGTDTNVLVEIGCPVVGWSEMRLPLKKKIDAVCVLRTAMETDFVLNNRNDGGTKFSMKSPLRLRVFVDGREIDAVSAPLDTGKKRFSEVVFTIPGEFITRDRCFVQIFGDHIAFCYWFYQ